MGSVRVVLQWQNCDPTVSLYTPYASTRALGGWLELDLVDFWPCHHWKRIPNHSQILNMSLINDLANIRSTFFFPKEVSGCNNLTGTVFTWLFPSELFARHGRRRIYKSFELKLHSVFVSLVQRSSKVEILRRNFVVLRLSLAVEFWTI